MKKKEIAVLFNMFDIYKVKIATREFAESCDVSDRGKTKFCVYAFGDGFYIAFDELETFEKCVEFMDKIKEVISETHISWQIQFIKTPTEEKNGV